MLEGTDIDPRSAIDPLTKSVRFRQVSILKRKSADSASLKRAHDLHRELFSKLPREDEDGLVTDTRESLTGWQSELKSYSPIAASKFHPGRLVIEQAISRIGKQLAIRDSYEFIENLLAGKNDWLELSEDVHDVISFYKTQIKTWQRMLDAMSAFNDNHEALQQDPNAANAIKELEAIRDNPTPYGQINRIDALLNTVETVNAQIAGNEREIALSAIDKKLAEIETALDQVHADVNLRNKALYPMQQLKAKVAGLSSIPQIHYLAGQAGKHLDTAMDLISSSYQPVQNDIKEPGTNVYTGVKPVAVVPKPIALISASRYSTKSYLEDESDVDAYLVKLKDELLAAIKQGKKVRIQ